MSKIRARVSPWKKVGAVVDRLLERLDSTRRERGGQEGIEAILTALAKVRFRDPGHLRRVHDALLYLEAHPSRPAVRRRARAMLRTFADRVAALEERAADLESADHSGIAETSVTTSFSFDLLRSLSRCAGKSLRIDWELQDAPDRLAATLPRFLPLLEEESLVDANVPYFAWLDAARIGGELAWLLSRFAGLSRSPVERAELFDALALPVTWNLGRSRWSRTALRIPGGRTFFHGKKLLSRRDIDLRKEIAGPRLPTRRLPASAGRRALDAARAALATRYREFYGFNQGDAARADEVDAGRGVRIYFFGLPPPRRLPLRAGSASLVTRNGVPVGYGDGFALFERVDVSFNIFPEFRDGETAFIFARLLEAYRQRFGVTVFSIDPYQIGFQNEEAIESGAFWFYRRLGFRSVSPALEDLARREEDRVASRRGYRTPPRALRKLARSGMVFDAGSADGRAWDRFHIRNIGLAVQGRMAASGLSAPKYRERCAARLASLLPGSRRPRDASRSSAFAALAPVLDLLPNLARWSAGDLHALARILDAKSAPSEERYVRLLQRHDRLRRELIRAGSRSLVS